MKKIISVKNVSFSYSKDNKVLNKINFSIDKGEYISLIGPNGSGKSTIAKLLCYLLEPDEGTISINGKILNDKNIKSIRKDIGIVFQNPDNQFIGSTVEDDIAFGLENRNIPQKEMKELVYKYAKKVGVEDLLDKEPTLLSGGQKQRVALAGILALNLKIIILDEATSMLDPEAVEDIKELINELKKDNPELTIISITHDLEEASNSDRVIILDKGEIYRIGTPEEIFTEDFNVDGLELPFIYKIKNKLSSKGIKIDDDVKNIEDLGRFLCN